MSVAPPLEHVSPSRPRPWLLHELHVNTMNFCPFAVCGATLDTSVQGAATEILVAVPNALVSDSVCVA